MREFKVGMVFRAKLNGFKNTKITIVKLMTPLPDSTITTLRIRALGSEFFMIEAKLQSIIERDEKIKKIKKINWLKEGF